MHELYLTRTLSIRVVPSCKLTLPCHYIRYQICKLTLPYIQVSICKLTLPYLYIRYRICKLTLAYTKVSILQTYLTLPYIRYPYANLTYLTLYKVSSMTNLCPTQCCKASKKEKLFPWIYNRIHTKMSLANYQRKNYIQTMSIGAQMYPWYSPLLLIRVN